MNNFLKLVNNKLKFSLFLIKKLPAAYLSGVRVKIATEEMSQVTVPYKWLSQNPFKSTYFASLSMAAEMSTGLLALAHVYKSNPAISMLVVNIKGDFLKKATNKTTFTCNDGMLIKEAIQQSIIDGQSKTIIAKSIGLNEQGETVALFELTWSFKAKNK